MIYTCTLSSLNLPLPLDVNKGASVTIGNFDGMHLGHQALLALTRQRAIETGTVPVAITFDPHPLELLTPHAPPRLTATQARLALLEASGMALVILIAFTPEVASMSPENFVQHVLLDSLNMRELFLGYDFTLGKGRAGTPEVLAHLGHQHGFKVEQLSALRLHGDVVSSTRIRGLLRQGDVAEVRSLLGRLYTVRGEVIHGQNRGGNLLGFPTANLPPLATMLPKPGAYATLAMPISNPSSNLPAINHGTEQGIYAAVTNIGYNPTFGSVQLSVETHLLDFAADIYGQQLEVAFLERLRGERKFSGPQKLQEQIRKDIEQARNICSYTVKEQV